MEIKDDASQYQQMRRIAFIAVVFSTAAVITVVITLPMLYSYIQSFHSHLMLETDYCKASIALIFHIFKILLFQI